jgi:Gas vesicle synthesis protein GvpL/GvpF
MSAITAHASRAVYVFAVCRDPGAGFADHVRRLTGLPGDGVDAPPRLLPFGSLTAVVQDVPAAAFREEALRERFSDSEELERCARSHHEVVHAAASRTTTVPLPLATIYLGDERARDSLAEGREQLGAALDLIEGSAGWGVTLCGGPAEPARPEVPSAAEAAEVAESVSAVSAVSAVGAAESVGAAAAVRPGAGRAYLERMRGRQRTRELRQEAGVRAAERVDLALRGLAVAARRLRTHGAELTGPGRGQMMNAAYLVRHDRGGELAAAVEGLRHHPELRELEIRVSGPWPCYSFTDAGSFDLAASDVGASDAGSSVTGASDAGSSEAGASDARSSEARSSHAGAFGAGVVGARAFDAGAFDGRR